MVVEVNEKKKEKLPIFITAYHKHHTYHENKASFQPLKVNTFEFSVKIPPAHAWESQWLKQKTSVFIKDKEK